MERRHAISDGPELRTLQPPQLVQVVLLLLSSLEWDDELKPIVGQVTTTCKVDYRVEQHVKTGKIGASTSVAFRKLIADPFHFFQLRFRVSFSPIVQRVAP